MRRQQQERMARLIDMGFTIIESNYLKQIPFSMPYMRNLINDRRKLFRMAVNEGWGRNKYIQAIGQTYNARGWKIEGERLSKTNIFRMVRDYQADWKLTAPPEDVEKWVSPSAKKSHHGSSINRDKLRKQKLAYNSRPEVKEKRRLYRLKNRDKIREAERKRKLFKRGLSQ